MSYSMFDRMMEAKESTKSKEHRVQEIANGTFLGTSLALEKHRRHLKAQEEQEAADTEREAVHKEANERACDLVRRFFESKGFGGDGFKHLPEVEFQAAYTEFNGRVRAKRREIKKAILRNHLRSGIRTIVALIAIPCIARVMGYDVVFTLFTLLDLLLIPGVVLKMMCFRRGDAGQENKLIAYKMALKLASGTRKRLENMRAGKDDPELSL